MTREEVFARLNEVFRDVFDDEEITVSDATTADDIEEGIPWSISISWLLWSRSLA